MSDTTLIFLHLPKTGGTTVRRAIFRGVPGDRRIAVYPGRSVEPGSLGDVPQHSRAKAAIVAGHLSYGAHEVFDQQCRYITVVRDPVKRVLSQFSAHVRRRERRGDEITDLPKRFEEWIEDPKRSGPDANGMTRRISGTGDRGLGPDHLSAALGHIDDHFAAIATTAGIHELIGVVADLGGWDRPRRIVARNVSDRRISADELAGEHLRSIEEANALDRQLYDWVDERAGAGVYRPG